MEIPLILTSIHYSTPIKTCVYLLFGINSNRQYNKFRQMNDHLYVLQCRYLFSILRVTKSRRFAFIEISVFVVFIDFRLSIMIMIALLSTYRNVFKLFQLDVELQNQIMINTHIFILKHNIKLYFIIAQNLTHQCNHQLSLKYVLSDKHGIKYNQKCCAFQQCQIFVMF